MPPKNKKQSDFRSTPQYTVNRFKDPKKYTVKLPLNDQQKEITSKKKAQHQEKRKNSSAKSRQGSEKRSSSKKEMRGDGKYYSIRQNFQYLLKHYNYKVIKQIGRGGYGVVYKAHNLLSHQSVPSKQPKSQTITQTEGKTSQIEAPYECAIKINFDIVSREIVYSEMAFLQIFKFSHSTRLPEILNAFIHEEIPHFVLKFYKSSTYMAFFNKLFMADIKHYLLEMLIALQELRNLGIYHRDVKPGNFLYDLDKKRGVLVDFGIAELCPTFMKKFDYEMFRLRVQIKQYEKKNTTNEEDPKEFPTSQSKQTEEQKLKGLRQKMQRLQPLYKQYKQMQKCHQSLVKNKVGTEVFMPLESLLRDPHQSYQIDVWSVGVVFLQFITRKYNVFNNILSPEDIEFKKHGGSKSESIVQFILKLQCFFDEQKVKKVCSKLGYLLKLPKKRTKKLFDFKQICQIESFDENAENLLRRMLQLDGGQRIKVDQAIRHPFFDEVRSQHPDIPANQWIFERE